MNILTNTLKKAFRYISYNSKYLLFIIYLNLIGYVYNITYVSKYFMKIELLMVFTNILTIFWAKNKKITNHYFLKITFSYYDY